MAALLALPASAAAGQERQVAALAGQQCAQERADLGKRVFRKRSFAASGLSAPTLSTAPG